MSEENDDVENSSSSPQTNSQTSTGGAIGIRGVLSGSGSISVSMLLAVHFSIFHVQAAAIHARRSAEIEKIYQREDDELRADYLASVTGAIFASVAFLEATINELFDQAHLGANNLTTHLGVETARLLGAVWDHVLSDETSVKTLEKYQLALQLARKTSFIETESRFPPEEGSFPDIANLISLRNALMHYKLVWAGPQETRAVRRRRHFLEAKFGKAPSPLYEPNSHFLYVYLGHACASWAVRAVVGFADDFYARLGLPAPYDHLRRRLNTE